MEDGVTLVSGTAFVELFRTFAHTARRLEVRDRYDSPSEHEPLRRFLAGEPKDMGWIQNWTRDVGQAVADGKVFQRVRVVSVPLSDYARFGLDLSRHNIATGEDIRSVDRRDAEGVPGFDYWVFDSARAWRGWTSPRRTSCSARRSLSTITLLSQVDGLSITELSHLPGARSRY
ncbi:DUF6879 family protein [Spirillospora sp. NPDC052269]